MALLGKEARPSIENMIIEKNKVVVVDYKLQKDNAQGELVEETTGGEPLKFIFGIGMMIPGFESELEGKKSGDEVAFQVHSEDAYGEYEDEALIDIAIENFQVDGKVDYDNLKLGQMITMQDMQGGVHRGVIKKVGLDKVQVDFNHPMAGQDLFFTVNVREVREATESELDHGHVHE